MAANVNFKDYLNVPTSSNVLNLKVLLLTNGLDFDFKKIRNFYPQLKNSFKVNKIKVSDRHFIAPEHSDRDYIPDELLLFGQDKESVVKVYYKESSPFLFTVENENFVITEKKTGNIFPVTVKPVPVYPYAKKQISGIYCDEYVSVVGTDRISIIPYDGCDNWNFGKECLFCGANPTRLGFGGYKPNIADIRRKYNGDIRNWWENEKGNLYQNIRTSFQELLKDNIKPHFHFAIISGNLPDLDYEWEIAFDIVNKINDLINLDSIDSHLELMPPKDMNYIAKAKEYGFQNIAFNLECYDEEYFKQVCPGKESVYGYQNIINALEKSIKYFGKGHVRSNFVLGAEPFPLLLAGARKLAEKGIVADYSIFFPRPGSVWHNREIPEPDSVIEFTKELVTIYRQNGFKPFCCTMGSRSSIANEVFELYEQ